MQKATDKTYFLMRNGGNIYRICTDLEVGVNLFPTANEFNLFFESGRGEDREFIRPGSLAYQKSMERADARTRHYMRILLFLQGLLTGRWCSSP